MDSPSERHTHRARSRVFLACSVVAVLSIPIAGWTLTQTPTAPVTRVAVVATHERVTVPSAAPPSTTTTVDPAIARDRAQKAGLDAAAAIVRYVGQDYTNRHPAVVHRHLSAAPRPRWASPPPMLAGPDGPFDPATQPDWAMWHCTALHEAGPAPGTGDGVWWTNDVGRFAGPFDIAVTTWQAFAGTVRLLVAPGKVETVSIAAKWPRASWAPPWVQIIGARNVRARVHSGQWGGLRACGG